MSDALRYGIVGAGMMGHEHIRNLALVEDAEVVAVADYFQDKADALGEKRKVAAGKRFTTLSGYKRLLDEDLDAVAVMSPPYFHPEQAAAAIESTMTPSSAIGRPSSRISPTLM